MALYYACLNIAAVQSAPVGGQLPAGSQSVQPIGQNNPNTPPTQFTWTIKGTGIGSFSATAQLVGSQDGTTWENVGSTVTGTANNADITPASKSTTVNNSFNFYSAYITAISGTKAAATVIISA